MVSKKLIIFKLMHGYNFFKAKNGDNPVKAELLLFAVDHAINKLFI